MKDKQEKEQEQAEGGGAATTTATAASDFWGRRCSLNVAPSIITLLGVSHRRRLHLRLRLRCRPI